MDSFGTEAQFNYNLFKENIPGGSMAAFGRHNLDLRQYQTMFREYWKLENKVISHFNDFIRRLTTTVLNDFINAPKGFFRNNLQKLVNN